MRTAILAFGTRGDVVPLTGLAGRLQSDGHDVVLAAQEPYRAEVTGAGVAYAPLPKDTRAETLASPAAQALVDGRTMRPSKESLEEMREGLRGVGQAMATAAEGSDLLLLEGPVGALLGRHVAAALGVRSAGMMFQPASATGDFSPPALGVRSYGWLGNRFVWWAGGFAERVYAPVIAELRHDLGLPAKPSRAERDRSWPVLHPFSEHVLPRPADWPEHVRVTGYLRPEPVGALGADLEAFLSNGPPPVAVTLGSTATANGAAISAVLAEATAAAGVRAVVQRGWAGLDPVGEHLLVVDEVPHALLFPRCAAVIHHCGAGTTAAALHAGAPSIPVPGIMDQPFWAQRLHRLGAGTAPLPRHSLTADGLTEALRTVEQHRPTAERIGAALRAEDGATRAAAAISDLFHPS
ncbi:glycosyltransferase [Tsukamurella ocularis]|uniref:glycosyltransferase n=1 Tax=Tsukamurella ocularis TaxID=1970234 RepID=UPI002169F7E6|nr:glycosyltransferase [Tsukamurella ocularis]MCS3779633.1 UDP:flavonoid glycosyltransferase YjiC (YdhE family) [Tsukamurella ocularis]MCS3788967.1 UDP:flavonoid glycosyltransferase YjiC (YdhE family) [Tsukamurella ocularis]MCS3850177.1 UDP:flavonoid glycosyltransferase YjiC (YdhE family) [Tsukamurella ocularis]